MNQWVNQYIDGTSIKGINEWINELMIERIHKSINKSRYESININQ